MPPLEFMQRMAALVPRPQLHLIRFHGVLAPNAKLRASSRPDHGEGLAHFRLESPALQERRPDPRRNHNTTNDTTRSSIG